MSEKRFYDKLYFDGCIKAEKRRNYRIACDKCGWMLDIISKNKCKICPRCGKMVYLDKKQEFVERIKSEMRK